MQLITIFIPFVAGIFWLWMFRAMLINDDIPSSEPIGFRWPPQSKTHWTIFFIIFNLLTALYYYFMVYIKD